MAVYITTTGTQNPVTLDDLGGRFFPHPTVSYDLELEYSISELQRSQSLQNAISSGYITVTNESGENITSISNLQPITQSEVKTY